MPTLPRSTSATPAAAAPAAAAQGGPLWLCWTNNCRGKLDSGLYVLHATTDAGAKTLCGCRIQEFGERLTPENLPSCKRCRSILAQWRALPAAPLP